jgi:hypothetical protein
MKKGNTMGNRRGHLNDMSKNKCVGMRVEAIYAGKDAPSHFKIAASLLD